MIAKLNGAILYGVKALHITVEVSVTNGIGYTITGLPDDTLKESLGRIGIALTNLGFQMPRTKLVINMTPAHIRKKGTSLELPIAIGILLASGQLPVSEKIANYWLAGEIGLDGAIHPVAGTLAMACQAIQEKYASFIVPMRNAPEACIVPGIDIYGADHLTQALSILYDQSPISPSRSRMTAASQVFHLDFKEVKGQTSAKRALEIAAAGGHNALLIGPPGSGKTMLAQRLPSILPPMTMEEALETTRIYSVTPSQSPLNGLIAERPFRAPHHTVSDIALAGGGLLPLPGEISLAHNGVLFLDELPEFNRRALEALRQPMEERKLLVSRSRMSLEFPANFMLIAAMNPCPCGYHGHPYRSCTCSAGRIQWYHHKLSGPLLERIDLHIVAEVPELSELFEANVQTESSETIRQRVIKARQIQEMRFKGIIGVYNNAQLPETLLHALCPIEPAARRYLLHHMKSQQLSHRAFGRVLKIARTIADLSGKSTLELAHVVEALYFRGLDKPSALSVKKIL